jgi:uncharacterized protein YndB with AHSA1/START domain
MTVTAAAGHGIEEWGWKAILLTGLMSRTDFGQGQGGPRHDRRACMRLDPHIAGHQGAARGALCGLLDPAALIDWLPSAEMTGEIHEFDARGGGGFRMSLFYPPDERSFRCKTSDREDRVNVRFVELAPPRRIVEAVSSVTTDPAFFGEMTMMATFEEVFGGTEVTLVFENLPPGLRAEDNEAGSRLSLAQLARRFA